jgi:competence protein ComEC
LNALPFLWLSFFFLLGLFTAHFFFLPNLILFSILFIGLILTLLERHFGNQWKIFKERPRISPLAWGILWIAFCVGFLRQQTSQIPITREQVGWYNNSGIITLAGKVAAPPTKSERVSQVRFEVERLILADGQEISPIRGMVLLWLPKDSEVEYGDQLQAQGKLIVPFEDTEFSYKEYLARQGIFSLMSHPGIILIKKDSGSPVLSGIYSLRAKAYQTLRQIMPMPEASVLAGILLGIQSDIPEYLYQAYQASGTAHILVISGFNIAIISALIARFFRRILPYGWDALASTAAIIFYTLLVGAQPPVVRAAIMGIISLPAYLLGRRSIHLNVLSFTAALMLFFSPNLLLDVSFQLSFLATLGIMVFSDPMKELVNRVFFKNQPLDENAPIISWLNDYLLVTLSAQIAVLPILLSHFDYLSLVTLPANLLILPAQPAVMVLGGIALLAGMLFLPAGQVIARLAWLPTFYSDQVALWLGTLPFAMLRTSSNWVWLAWVIFLGLLVPALRFHFQFGIKTITDNARTG